jgi:V8-like Glu-specific endopeptidase
MLLTNHHVVHSKSAGTPATAASAQFGYDDNGQGGFLPGTVFPCDVTTIQADKVSDWAVLLAVDNLPDSIPVIDLNNAVPAKLNDQAFIIQHPQAGTKKIGYVRNSVSNVDDTVAHYLTDTQEGASGAPVFNEQGEIIAVHRAGGRPIELPGKQPMKKNEGVLISRILKDFHNKNIVVV